MGRYTEHTYRRPRQSRRAQLDGDIRRTARAQNDLSATEDFRERLLQFVNWDNQQISATEAITAGFSPKDDATGSLVCKMCGLKVCEIQANTDLLQVHITSSPDCEFVRERTNKYSKHLEKWPLSPLSNATIDASRMVGEMHQPLSIELHMVEACETHSQMTSLHNVLQHLTMGNDSTYEDLGIEIHNPGTLSMSNEDARKKSFQLYECVSQINVTALATHGLFWAGADHKVECFACGYQYSIHNPRLSKHALSLHASNSSKCKFLTTKFARSYLLKLAELSPEVPNISSEESLSTAPDIPDRLVKPLYDHPIMLTVRSDPEILADLEGGPPAEEEFKELIKNRKRLKKPEYSREHEILSDLISLHAKAKSETASQASKTPTPKYEVGWESSPLERSNAAVSSQAAQASGVAEPTWNQSNSSEITDSLRCTICLNDLRTVMFVPCTHTIGCGSCVLTMERCPYCRRQIMGTIRVNYD